MWSSVASSIDEISQEYEKMLLTLAMLLLMLGDAAGGSTLTSRSPAGGAYAQICEDYVQDMQ